MFNVLEISIKKVRSWEEGSIKRPFLYVLTKEFFPFKRGGCLDLK
jgi:hypothetical protein